MFINEMLMKMVYYLEVFKPWFSSGVYNYFIEKKTSVFSWLSTYTVHAMQSGNALQLTNHILKWCFRVSTGCPVVFFILEEENTGPYLDRRFTSLVCIYLWLLLLSCYYSYWVCWRYSTYQLSKSDLLCKM